MGRFFGPLNFSEKVLEPAMTAFAEDLVYTPPAEAVGSPYDWPVRGSWSADTVEIGEGEILARGTALAVGVRLAEFPADRQPVQGGRISRADASVYTIRAVLPDGRGGAHLDLVVGDVDL